MTNDEDEEWRAQAICHGLDPSMFYPDGGSNWAIQQREDARKVCAACPVREPCLDYALAKPERFGIWGGLDEKERQQLRSRRTA